MVFGFRYNRSSQFLYANGYASGDYVINSAKSEGWWILLGQILMRTAR